MATIAPHLLAKGEEKLDEEEQLLKLFWNRAELKKELKLLRDDSFRLGEELKQQEAKTLRVQQRLEQLEVTLGNPKNAMVAVTHYRLKAIWNYCRSRLESLASELARAQYDKAHRHHVVGFKRQIDDSLLGVHAELKTLTDEDESLSATIRALREERNSRRGPWNFFRRRALAAKINDTRVQQSAIRLRIDELTEVVTTRQSLEPPEFAGLDIAAKRRINLSVIAYAQELFLHFAGRELAKQIRDSSVQQLVDASYGDARDCRGLCRYADERMELLAADTKVASRVQFRAEKIKRIAEFRHDDDTIPVASTLGLIPFFDASGEKRGEVAMNVLGEEYWDVFSALLT
jgi:hypothetical protein